MSSASSSLRKYDPDFLKQMSLLTDPECESIIGDVAAGHDFEALRDLFKHLKANGQVSSDNALPDSVIQYFNSNNQLPEWADQNKIKIAQEVFAQNGPEIALILNYKALPLCYACKNGAKVLATTGRLLSQGSDTTKMMRRLLETSQMVINVMSEGGLSPNGEGIITVKKVRLYHAAIRYFLLNSGKNSAVWDAEVYGQPINQEEMAGTLMAFSALVINGLTQVGVELSKEQKDAYIHIWNIVGHFIGLDPRLYPESFEEAWELGISIIKRNLDESDNGKFLVDSLIQNSKEYFFKSSLFDSIPEYLIGFFVEDVSKAIDADIAKAIGLDSDLNFLERLEGKLFVEAIDWFNELEEHVPFIRKFMMKNSIRHMNELVEQYLKVNNVDFYIPDSLKSSWKMN